MLSARRYAYHYNFYTHSLRQETTAGKETGQAGNFRQGRRGEDAGSAQVSGFISPV